MLISMGLNTAFGKVALVFKSLSVNHYHINSQHVVVALAQHLHSQLEKLTNTAHTIFHWKRTSTYSRLLYL